MPTGVNATDTFCLDPAYSTTRLVTQGTPVFDKPSDVKFQSMLFLPPNPDRKGEGGLRTRGYFKQSLPDKPLITVITVVFNGAAFLENTIKSVVNQTYDNVEYVIIDGGSTDGSVDIIKEYEGQIDYWVSERDGGIYDAMNKAVTLSLGDWVYVLGSDDVLFAEALEKVSCYLKSQNTAYYGNVKLLSSGEIYAGSFGTYKMMYYNISHQSIFYPKSFYESNKYNEKYSSAADFELLMRCHGTRKYIFQYIPELIAEYNNTDGISSRQEDQAFILDRKNVVKKNFRFIYYLLYVIRYYTIFILKLLRIKAPIKLMISRIVK